MPVLHVIRIQADKIEVNNTIYVIKIIAFAGKEKYHNYTYMGSTLFCWRSKEKYTFYKFINMEIINELGLVKMNLTKQT